VRSHHPAAAGAPPAAINVMDLASSEVLHFDGLDEPGAVGAPLAQCAGNVPPVVVSGMPEMHSVLNGRYAWDVAAMWNECPLFRKIHETGVLDDVYRRRLEQGIWAFNSHYPQHDPQFATAVSKDRDKLHPTHVTSWKALNNKRKLIQVDSIQCLAVHGPGAGTECEGGSSSTAPGQQQKETVCALKQTRSLEHTSPEKELSITPGGQHRTERVGALRLPLPTNSTSSAALGCRSTTGRERILQPPAALPPSVWDRDRVRLFIDSLPTEFEPFTVSEPFGLCQVDTCRSHRAPARSYLDGIQSHLLFKFSQVVKDKDIALLNATTTDSVVPDGEQVAHTNCIAHTHMHLAKMSPGALVDKKALPYALD